MHTNDTTRMERWIEGALLATRFVIAIPVVFSVLLALAALYVATVDAAYVLSHLGAYASGGSAHSSSLRVNLVTSIIKAFDTYLIAAVLLIFAIGLYELFISRLEVAEREGFPGHLLYVRSLDDLKNRLARLVLLVLVVEVLQQGLQMTYATALDVMELAVAALLVGGAVFLSDYHHGRSESGVAETQGAHPHNESERDPSQPRSDAPTSAPSVNSRSI